MGNNKKRKAAATVGAVTLVAALVLTGTYAWNSISQTAKNENTVYSNPGGRLHDDWDGSDPYNGVKQVYVENFTGKDKDGNTDTNAAPIYVRVKLQTYMEFGAEAGVTQTAVTSDSGTTYTDMDDEELGERNVKQLVSGTQINKPDDWPVYIYGQSDAFQSYVEMKTEFNKELDYMPTFNKNKESLMPDINGTYTGKSNTTDHFDDFVDYSTTTTAAQKEYWYKEGAGNGLEDAATIPGTDADYEEVGDGENSVSHTSAKTGKTTKIITMEQWLGYDDSTETTKKNGDYWIYDEDGWAYWANPVKPSTATGPLLTNVSLKQALGDNCYYAINVTGEFASAGDWGKDDSGAETGFYKNGITDNAITLLNTLAKTSNADWVDVEATSTGATADASTNTIVVEPGATVNLTGTVTLMGEEASDQGMTWSLDESNVTRETTKLSTTTGSSTTLTVDAAETPKTLKVTVTPDANTDVKVLYKIKVAKPDTVTITNAPERLTPGTATQATTMTLQASVTRNSQTYSNQTVTWSMIGQKNGSYINPSTGELSIPAAEVSGTTLTVTAKSAVDDSVLATKEIRVTKSELPLDVLKTIDKVKVTADGVLEGSGEGPDGSILGNANNTKTIKIDGVNFYVIAKKDGKALLLTEEKLEQRVFFDTDVDAATPAAERNWWASSTIRSWLNGTTTPYVALDDNGAADASITYNTSEAGWLVGKADLAREAIPTTIHTLQEFDGTPATDTNTTTDKIFFLSEADIYGTTGSVSTTDIPANYYTLTKTGTSGEEGVKLVAPNGSWIAKWDTSAIRWYWQRSPRGDAKNVGSIGAYGYDGAVAYTSVNGGVRPACWINL